MRKVLYKYHSIRSSFLGEKESSISARDMMYELDLSGLPEGIKVIKLNNSSSYAIYLNGDRIVEHRSDFLKDANTSPFAKTYFSVNGNDKIYFKGYEPAYDFSSLSESITEKDDKYGGQLIELKGEDILRCVLDSDIVSWFRYLFAPREERESVMTELGFEYNEKIDPVFAVILFLFKLNEFE